MNMKIYTRTGDSGETGFIGGRIKKDDHRVEAYGTVDELNSMIGYAVSLLSTEMFSDLKNTLQRIQHELFDCGTDLALLKEGVLTYKISPENTETIEKWIDHYDQENRAIAHFILPGGSQASSVLHICRTICRRAERRVVTLASHNDMNPEVKRYLNRLSDLLFVLARTINSREDIADIEYKRSAEVTKPK